MVHRARSDSANRRVLWPRPENDQTNPASNSSETECLCETWKLDDLNPEEARAVVVV
jgi:hypothetical protein